MRSGQNGECGLATVDEGGTHLPMHQDVVQNTSVGGVIVYDQNWHLTHVERGRAGGSCHWFEGHSKDDGEMESASLSYFTFQPQPPSHQLHQLSRHRQAEAGACVLPSH